MNLCEVGMEAGEDGEGIGGMESDDHRRARFSQLTAAGRRRLEDEVAWWHRAIGGVDRVHARGA